MSIFILLFGQLLDLLDGSEYSEIIDWMPHGRAFLVIKPKLFASLVLPHYFKQSKFLSFTRQLNLWGFKRITRGIDAGAYYHELFLRDRPYLVMRMQRHKVKGTGMKLIPNPKAEPNFYEDWPEVPKSTSRKNSISKRTVAILPTSSSTTEATSGPVERLELQQLINSRPNIYNSLTSGRGDDMLSVLLQAHRQLQHQLQHHQSEAETAAAFGSIIGEQPSIAEISHETINNPPTKDLMREFNELKSLKFGSGSATTAGGRGELSTVTAAVDTTAYDSQYTPTLIVHNDITSVPSARFTNHHTPSFQGQSVFPPATYHPRRFHPVMSYDNFLQSTASTNPGGMSMYDRYSRHCYLDQHPASFACNHQAGGTLNHFGGGRIEGGGGLHPNDQAMIPDELAAMIQAMNHHRSLTTLGNSGIYPPLHQRLSSSDRLLVMERLRDLNRAQQRGAHGHHPQDIFDGLAGMAPPPHCSDGSAAITDVVHPHQNLALGLVKDINTGSLQPPSYPYPAVVEAPHPSTRTSTSPAGSGRSSTLSTDDEPRQEQNVARDSDDPVVPSSITESQHEASHLDILALAQHAKTRSMVLADTSLQTRFRGVVGAMPTSPPEKSPMILDQTHEKDKPISPPIVAADPFQRKRPSIGRPFGRKSS